MDLSIYFKSILEQDQCAVVICDLEHTIIYMNPAAISAYKKRGGSTLLNQNVLDCHNPQSVEKIKKVVAWFERSKENNIVHTFYEKDENKDVYMVALRDEEGNLIGYYEKHEIRIVDTAPFYEMN